MDRLKDKEIGEMWTKNYPRRREKESRLLLTALVNIIKGNSLIIASKDGGNYPKTLGRSLCSNAMSLHISFRKSKNQRRIVKADEINPNHLSP